MTPRVLLLEFLNRDRYSQYRSEDFPFLKGWADANGVPLRWVCVGFDPARLPNGPYRMALSDEDAATLVRVLREHAPTHVLTNEELDAPLAEMLRAAAGEARFGAYMLESDLEFGAVGRLRAWLGLPAVASSPDHWLYDEATPSYHCELINGLSREIHPFVQIVGGPLCVYHAPLDRNPAFAGVDLSAAHRRVGCSFCGVTGDHRYRYATPPVALALKQLRAARATCPPERNRGEYAIAGAAIFMRLGPLFEALLAEGFPPSDFSFACRIDELLRKAHHVEALLPRLRAAGHSISIYNMGVENFSPAENLRLNKGITPEDVAAAHARMARWEAEWPETFRFSKNGGFGFILFTPWTTADDLRTNLAWTARLRVEASSFVFVSRLQLLPARPLTLLAEHDGLLAPDFDEATLRAFDSGCIVSAVVDERPWRFRVPAMAAVYGVFTLWRQHATRPDADATGPLALLRRLLLGLPPDERTAERFLGEVLDAAEAHPDVRTADALLTAVAARLAPRLAPVAAPVAPEPPPSDPHEAEREAVRALVAGLLDRIAAQPSGLLRGFATERVAARREEPGWGEVVVDLVRGEERLRVHVGPLRPGQHAFAATSRFALTHAEDTPVDTDEKQQLVRLLARALARVTGADRGGRR